MGCSAPVWMDELMPSYPYCGSYGGRVCGSTHPRRSANLRSVDVGLHVELLNVGRSMFLAVASGFGIVIYSFLGFY